MERLTFRQIRRERKSMTRTPLETTANPLRRLLWVTPWPILPPFAGSAGSLLKSYSAILGLRKQYEIDLITYGESGRCGEVVDRLEEFWKETPVRHHVIEYAPNPAPLRAWRERRFQLGLRVETPQLRDLLDELHWRQRDRLVVMGDIVFAPLARQYGGNLLLSPHDCISEMLKMHFQQALPAAAALKYYAQYRIARHYEQAYFQEALLIHVVTHRDRLMLQNINPRARYHVSPYRDRTSEVKASRQPPDVDVLIWADLRLAAVARGARAFIDAWGRCAQNQPSCRVLLVGRVDKESVSRLLGCDLPAGFEYGPRLEDDQGHSRRGAVTVIPDAGGTGIKTRLLHVLASGGCAACLYSQTEGIEWVADAGAINAHTLPDLAHSVRRALQTGSYRRTAARGTELFERYFSLARIEQAWDAMVERAVAVRESMQTIQ